MPENTQTNPNADTSDAAPADFLDKLDTLLSKLVPPASVTITKCDGTSVELPGAIPARRQVVVFRMMRDLSEQSIVREALASASDGSPTSVVDAVLALAVDLDVAERLGAIFDAAYPSALGEGETALDALPIEEIVVALVPFSERFIQRVGGGLSALASSAMDLTE